MLDLRHADHVNLCIKTWNISLSNKRKSFDLGEKWWRYLIFFLANDFLDTLYRNMQGGNS
jgi:hypothetical protein